MTASPSWFSRSASSASKQILPVAAPGLAVSQGLVNRAIFRRVGLAVRVVVVNQGVLIGADQPLDAVAQHSGGGPVGKGRAARCVQPEDALPGSAQQQGREAGEVGQLTAALRPWTIDFHVAQNDATVKGSGSHDKTGRHCLPDDPNGKLEIAKDAGYWLRDEKGQLTRKFQHICWDGCMFSNETMQKPETWNSILRAMISVRDAHGW